MKLQITFANPFNVSCKQINGETITVQPGQYLVKATEAETVFLVEHETFFFTVPRELWIRGKFFIDNCVSIIYLEEVNLVDQ